jgi:hypothetical protein
MEPNLRMRAAETGGDGRLVERAHRLESRPVLPPESELAPDAPELAKIAKRIAPWLAKRESIRDVTIVAGAALGRYEEAMQVLLDTFPMARIHLAIAAAHRWETEAWSHPRVSVTSLRSIPREILRAGAPLIVIRFAPWKIEDRWREQILKTPLPGMSRLKHALLAAVFALRPRVFARHLGDVIVRQPVILGEA